MHGKALTVEQLIGSKLAHKNKERCKRNPSNKMSMLKYIQADGPCKSGD